MSATEVQPPEHAPTGPAPGSPPRRAPRPRAAVSRLPVYSRATTGGVPIRWRASSNEAPVPPSPQVVAAAGAACARGDLYPGLHGDDLVDSLSTSLGLEPGRLAVGSGSLALLDQLLAAYVEPGDEVVHAWRSYEAYPISIAVAHGRGVPVGNTPDGGHDLPALAAAVAAARSPAALVLCNPNNPTGAAFGLDPLLQLLAAVPEDVLVVLDEAYHDFVPAERSFDALALLAGHRNLVVLRTFSKAYSLAGLRVGYAVADPEVIAALRAVQPPFPVSAPAAAAAVAALADRSHRDATVALVTAQRDELTAALRAEGLPVVDSAANFVWLPLGERAVRAAERCAAAGVAVRCFAGDGLRISVGHAGLVPAVVAALRGLR